MVTMVLGRPNTIDDPIDFDEAEWRAVDLLAEGGLISPLRLVPMVAEPGGEQRRQRSA